MKKVFYVPIFGGLGNQMFQAAHAIEFGKKYKAKIVFIDFTNEFTRIKRGWQLNCFNIRPTKISIIKKLIILFRIKFSSYLIKINKKFHLDVLHESKSKFKKYKSSEQNKKIIYGYWQSEKYFINSKDKVKECFSFPSIGEEIINSENNVVAIHVRLGDYLNDKISNKFHYVCDQLWYFNAIKTMRDLLKNPKFIVYSDDLDMSKKMFKNLDLNFKKTQNNKAWIDMRNISFCDHFIISNSSYSWWASYLGSTENSITVAPKFWYPGQLTNELPIWRKEWILI